MAPNADAQGRRRTMHLFQRAPLPSHLTVDTSVAKDDRKRLRKKTSKRSLFHLGGSTSPESRDDPASPHERPSSAASKPRTLQKGRPSSVFGSLGRRSSHLLVDDDDNNESTGLRSLTVSSPVETDQDSLPSAAVRAQVLHHGEVQTTTGLFRKKKEYMVLTETHLVRFKSQSRAAESYPSIPSSFTRQNTRHPSTTSIGSLQEVQSTTSHTSIDGDNAIPLHQIVTAYRVDDGRPFFTTEVVWLDEEYNGAGSLQMMLYDPKEADLWHTSIRAAAQKTRLLTKQPFPDRVVRYVANILDAAQDYDADHFRIFRVVRRTAPRMISRASSDDLAKLGTSVFYLAVGLTRLHLIPVPDFSELRLRHNTKIARSALGLVTLIAMDMDHSDDALDLGFRNPLQPPIILELASCAAPEIVTLIFQSIIFLKPQWLDYTFLYGGPKALLDAGEPVHDYEEDNGCFDRTLVAYCLAYQCNPSNIRYTVDYEVDDAPEFQLLQPAQTLTYTPLELLSILRALRYNECFQSISFSGVSLQCLHGLYDPHGFDHIALSSRVGADIRAFGNLKNPDAKSLLYQETQALALKAKRLRRLDFSDTLPRRRPRDSFEDDAEKDPGCEIISALMQLRRFQLTAVDSFSFSGIELGETDLEEFVLAFENRKTSLRSLNVSRCGLGDRGMQVVLNKLEHQNNTLECLNLADNPGRLSLETLPVSMSRFSKIRRLDISRVLMTSGDRALIEPQTLCSWRLEELILTGVSINDNTLDAIAIYLHSAMSDNLFLLQMDQCNLTGGHVALLMKSMTRQPGECRNLHLSVSANRLEKDNDDIVKAIEENQGPAQLTMRLVDYLSEFHFRELLRALRQNTTIRSLDISKATLPYDAGDDTCEALRALFADNSTLEELDISGEQAHLEIARFGIGLSEALTGLQHNTALKVLRIEHQNLGLEGANALSSVLEINETLTHIYCDRNEFSLQAFTILVNALEKNFTILDLPYMIEDQAEAAKRMVLAVNDNRAATPPVPDTKLSMRKRLTTLGAPPKEKPTAATSQDVDEAVSLLNQKWQKQIERMTRFLARNRDIALNFDTRENYLESNPIRPTTAISDGGIIEHVMSNATPRLELPNPLDLVASIKISDMGQENAVTLQTDLDPVVDDAAKTGPRFLTTHVFPFEEKGVFDMET